MEKNVLVADDQEGIVDILSTYLKKEGFHPIPSFDGEDALIKFWKYKPVLILLDIMMPKKDGLQVCKEIRKNSNTPIIMITAKNQDIDVIMGLDVGADDYVIKPFSPGTVMARVRAVLRRIELTEEQKNEVLRFAGLEINIKDYRTIVDGCDVNLTRKEMEILWMLAKNPGRVYTRDHLLDSIWGQDYVGDPRCVDTHIKRLRIKLKLPGRYSWDIKTIWGVGYKFEV